jgi:hypothetical protein
VAIPIGNHDGSLENITQKTLDVSSMAALYLHNAIWTPEHPEDRSSAGFGKPHLRSLSAGTLRTINSDHSHPTEPLLHASTSESIAYRDLLSRQPEHPDGPQAGWNLGLNFEGDPTTIQERKIHQEKSLRRRLRRFRIGKAILEFVFGEHKIHRLSMAGS